MKQIAKYTALIALIIVIFINNYSLINKEFPLISKTKHSGRYSDFRYQQKYHQTAQKIKKVINNKTVFIINSYKTHLSNEGLQSLHLKYYLTKNYIGGTFSDDIQHFQETISEVKPAYTVTWDFDADLNKLYKLDKNKEKGFYLFEITNYQPIETKLIAIF